MIRKIIGTLILLTVISGNVWAKIKWELVLSEPNQNGYGATIDQISCIDSMNCKALTSVMQFYFRLISSTDGGLNWHITHDCTVPDNAPTPDLVYAFTMAYVDSLHLFVSRNSGVISRSRDGGLTYDTLRLLSPKDCALIFPGEPSAWLGNLSMCDTLTGITANNLKNCILLSEDGWETFKEIKTLPALYGIGNGYCNTMHIFDKDNFLVYTFDKGLSRTTDGGQTWHFCDLPFKSFMRMRFKNDKTGYAAGSTKNGIGDQRIGYIVKTTDGGFTWNTILVDDKEPIFGLLDVDFKDDSVGIAVGKYGKLYETTDGGKTWEIQPPLEYEITMKRGVQVITFAGDHPLLGTLSHGLWRGTYETNGAAEETESPNNIEATAFPNPFREACMIKIKLDKASPIAVEIYDALGRAVDRREMFYSGSGELMFSPRLEASGLYRYRITAGQKTFTGSIVKE